MSSFHSKPRLLVFLVLVLIIIFSVSCSRSTPTQTDLPIVPEPTLEYEPTAVPPSPTPLPPTLPPALLETDPLPGAEIPLTSGITLRFNQSMERASVEAALSSTSGIEGVIEWVDDATLIYQPESALPPASEMTLTVGEAARSQKGLQMLAPVDIHYQTAGYLELAQTLPEDGAQQVDPASAVVAAFNYPVVPLGADPASLPAAFTLEPALAGRGEWVNTSTYIYYPELSLGGGVTYLARLNPDLTSTSGSPLDEKRMEWRFSVALPYPQTFEPAGTSSDVRLDQAIRVVFNQSMDPQLTEANFNLLDEQMQPVDGTFDWDEKFTTLTFTPHTLLNRRTTYTTRIQPGAASAAGQPLGEAFQAAWSTVPELSVYWTNPLPGGSKRVYSNVTIEFSSYLGKGSLEQFLTITPEISNLYTYLDYTEKRVYLGGDFQPETWYTVRIEAGLQDRWGGVLSQPYEFRFYSNSLDPAIYISAGQEMLFVTPQDGGIPAQVSNLAEIPLSVGSLQLRHLFPMLLSEGYTARQEYQPADAVEWRYRANVPGNRMQSVTLPLSPDGSPLDPGLYFLRIPLPDSYAGPYVLVVSNVQVTLKISSSEAFVWVTDLRTNTPVVGESVAVYLETNELWAEGITDDEGIFRAAVPPHDTYHPTTVAVVGTPGEDTFGMALSDWNLMVSPYVFGLRLEDRAPRTETYIYTDRPIYRPGQTVYFRLISRVEQNGRYFPPDLTELSVKIRNGTGSELSTFTLPLSDLGTASGEFTLGANSQPGYYSLLVGEDSLLFMVAEYRKPEIDLTVSLGTEAQHYGEILPTQVDARYFFGAPASGITLDWNLYVHSDGFHLPGYRVGTDDRRWMQVFSYSDDYWGGLGSSIASGQGTTDASGQLVLDLPTTFDLSHYNALSPLTYTLEVTATDESGQPVSARAEAIVHREDYYIGIRPDAWVAQGGQETGFAVRVVDWNGNSAGERRLHAEYRKLEWTWSSVSFDYEIPEPVITYTPVDSFDFVTSSDGSARIVLTPPGPGTFELWITGGEASTTLTQWVGGAGQPVWSNQPNQRLQLTPDREAYHAGDTAQVFVPNPLNQPALALVTLERDQVLEYQVITLPDEGSLLPLELTSDHAPNVYLSVQLIGKTASGAPDFRVGYLNLQVSPEELVLNVDLAVEPARAGPGEVVTVQLRVTDASGIPVQGEFSLAVVDLAVLKLADPFALEITEWFYGTQPLGVRMGMSLAAYAGRDVWLPGGQGGGGGGDQSPATRQKFPDTAYWNPSILTDANGEATLTLTLPDNLTTWQFDLRGITADHRVGQASAQIITSQELLVRPITPRFLVAGDRVQFAAVVQNNTLTELPVEVFLQGDGLVLEGAASQNISVPANDRVRVEWWGRVQDVAQLALVFGARGGGLHDLTQPADGAIPVLRYRSPQAFATAGILESAGEKLELVSLPSNTEVSANARAGGLRVTLAPSLGAAALEALEALEVTSDYLTEFTLSRLLSNLATWQIVQSADIDAPDLKEDLHQAIVESLSLLISRQGYDGGWGWRANETSDVHMSAYAVLALVQARQAGFTVNEYTLSNASQFLEGNNFLPHPAVPGWELDRQAFVSYVRMLVGGGDLDLAQALYRERARLSTWGQALLALTLKELDPGSLSVDTLFSDLQSAALRTASGASWEDTNRGYQNMSSGLSTTAIVTYSLIKHDPDSALLPDAMRYLMLNRQADGGWSSTYTTAWSLLALDAWVQATGELEATFSYGATLNGASIFTSQAGIGALNSETVEVPLNRLYAHDPNALAFQRTDGAGRLYYTAILDVSRPVSEVAPLNRGLVVSRQYYLPGEPDPVQSASSGELVTVRLRLVVPHDSYYVMVEDYIPAGAEVLNSSLKTTRQGFDEYGNPVETSAEYDPANPYADGWGWWLFGSPQIYDERITWMASYLPAGAYELTYRITLLQAGQFQVLPAYAQEIYFPDVQGSSAGALFEIVP